MNLIAFLIASIIGLNITLTITSNLNFVETINKKFIRQVPVKLWHSHLVSVLLLLFLLLNFDSISGDYCYPDCDNPSSALKFNSDGTFNSSTSAFGGMSRWGNWEKVDNDKIKLITTRISTNSNSDKVPPPQTIYIMSNGGLKIGSTIYIKG